MMHETTRAKDGRTRYSLVCPNCSSQLVIRISKQETSLTRAAYVQCPDPTCQAGYKASIELIQLTQMPINDFGKPMPPVATSAQKAKNIQDIVEVKEDQQNQKNLF